MSAERPEVVVFDVNETLSDMAPVGVAFEEVGAPDHLAATWFAALLRDGFALAATGRSAPFADIATSGLRTIWSGVRLDRDEDAAVAHVMAAFQDLGVHPDVADGVRRLRGLGIRLVTLSNGAASVAEQLLSTAGLREEFEALLSVEQAGVWKPAPASYRHALDRTGVAPDRAMLVAVHPWDVDGARAAGLRTAWVNRAAARYPSCFEPADLDVSSLEELADSLG
jgi:2-haloacid dehalogenase